jgi:putative solute:sodium symporter small subunit
VGESAFGEAQLPAEANTSDQLPGGASPRLAAFPAFRQKRKTKIVRRCGMSEENASSGEYWKANLRVVRNCLIVWAVVSFGFGIVLRPLLSGIRFAGTDLGFWFAQQGSILVFLVLIFYYAIRMNAIDRKFGVDEQ